MDIALAGSAITYQPNDDQLGGVSIQLAAFDGEVGVGSLPAPDPAAGIDVYDGRSCDVREISTLVVAGFIQDQERIRGPQPAGTARMHTFSVMDPNALLDGFRILSRTRPAETDVARVLAFAAADHSSWITTWVVNTETVTMPAKTYDADGGWMSELVPDLVEFTGKTLWVHDLAYGGRCLHYHNLVSGHTCGLTISDVPSAVNGVTVFAPGDPRRQRTSVDLRNDVVGRDQAGRTSSATDSTSIGRHDADGLQHESLQQFDTASQADLDVKTAAFLASNKDERDTYTCDLGPLDATALARIRVGDIITVTSSVMGLTASPQRISHMTLSVWTGSGGPPAPGLWMAALEMGAPVRRRRRSRPTAFTDEPWVCVPNEFRVPWSAGGFGGTAMIVDPTFAGEQHATTYTTPSGGDYMTLYAGATYRLTATGHPLVAPGDAYPHPEWGWIHFVGISTPDGNVAGRDVGGYPGGGGVPDPVYGEWAVDFTASATRSDYYGHVHAVNDVDHNSYLWSSSFGVRYISGADPRFEDLAPCSNGVPRPGQRVDDSSSILGTDDGLGDGTTTDFTATFPIEPGSLNIFCNGLDWTTDIASQDADAGTFVMAYPFPLASTVRIIYRRAS